MWKRMDFFGLRWLGRWTFLCTVFASQDFSTGWQIGLICNLPITNISTVDYNSLANYVTISLGNIPANHLTLAKTIARQEFQRPLNFYTLTSKLIDAKWLNEMSAAQQQHTGSTCRPYERVVMVPSGDWGTLSRGVLWTLWRPKV